MTTRAAEFRKLLGESGKGRGFSCLAEAALFRPSPPPHCFQFGKRKWRSTAVNLFLVSFSPSFFFVRCPFPYSLSLSLSLYPSKLVSHSCLYHSQEESDGTETEEEEETVRAWCLSWETRRPVLSTVSCRERKPCEAYQPWAMEYVLSYPFGFSLSPSSLSLPLFPVAADNPFCSLKSVSFFFLFSLPLERERVVCFPFLCVCVCWRKGPHETSILCAHRKSHSSLVSPSSLYHFTYNTHTHTDTHNAGHLSIGSYDYSLCLFFRLLLFSLRRCDCTLVTLVFPFSSFSLCFLFFFPLCANSVGTQPRGGVYRGSGPCLNS